MCACVLYLKVGFKGVYISRTCFPDMKRRGGGGSGVEWSIAFNHCHWLIVQFLLNTSVQTTRQTNRCGKKSYFNISNTCPCNIQRFYSPVKIENFIRKKKIFFLLLLKT